MTHAEQTATLTSIDGDAVPLRGVRATGRLNGLLFELEVEQTYENTGTNNIEAVYTFPVPLRAVLLGLDLTLGERHLTAVAQRRQQASERYEQAIDEGNTAALLEQAGEGLYTLSLGNLLAGERAVIRYRYAELLDRQQDQVRLAVPTVIAPRYGDAAAAGLDPHQTPGTDLLVSYPFTLSIDLHGTIAGAALGSPTHPVTVADVEGGKRVTLATGAVLDRDFVLQLSGPATRAASVVARDGEQWVALASLEPVLPEEPARPLQLKIVVDCSGSMGGDSIAQARAALLALLSRLGPRDRVSLTRFGSRHEHLTQGFVRTDEVAMARLRHAVQTMQADLGGTEMAGALQAALAIPGDREATSDVLLITDGEVWAIDQVVDLAAKSGHRLFAIAVGAAPVEALGRRLSDETGGACEFVTPREDIAAAVARVFARLRGLPKRVAAVTWPAEPAWTAPLPAALFGGDTFHVIAGFAARPTGALRLTVAGLPGGPVECTCELPVADSGDDVLPRLAAARRLSSLEEEQAAALAERYQLASEWTSFVVVQVRAEAEKATDLPVLARTPQMLAAGWGASGSVNLGSSLRFVSASLDADPMAEIEFLRDAAPGRAVSASLEMPRSLRVADTDIGYGALPAVERTPREVVLACAALPAAHVPTTVQELIALGVPEAECLRIWTEMDPSWDEPQVVRVWLAVLTRAVGDVGLTPEQRAMLEGAVFADRALRDLRSAMTRLLRGVTPDHWTAVAAVVHP